MDDVKQDLVLVARDGAVVRLTLNCPEKRNSLSRAMMAALSAELAALQDDDSCRVILLKGAGSVFSAGHDLKEIAAARADADAGRGFFSATMAECVGLMLALVRSAKPVIAVVEGMATAAGCQLVASCDLAVASAAARFATPGVHIGLFCSTPMVALSRNVPRKVAMQMLLTGVPIDAEQAEKWGLINAVAADADAKAMEFAEAIIAKPPATLRMGKAAFYDQLDMTLAEAYSHTAEVMVENMLHAEAVEGIEAFIEKRPAKWEGV